MFAGIRFATETMLGCEYLDHLHVQGHQRIYQVALSDETRLVGDNGYALARQQRQVLLRSLCAHVEFRHAIGYINHLHGLCPATCREL